MAFKKSDGIRRMETPTEGKHGKTRKPKTMVTPGDETHGDFQTPPEALLPLIWRLKAAGIDTVWEPACGEGNLSRELARWGFKVYQSDIKLGLDFFNANPKELIPEWSDTRSGVPRLAIVTNPPYSKKGHCKGKDAWLERCYTLGLPFALLLPLAALGGKGRHKLYREYGLAVTFLDGRPDFKTPSGKEGGSWFDAAWFCGRFAQYFPDIEGEPEPLDFGTGIPALPNQVVKAGWGAWEVPKKPGNIITLKPSLPEKRKRFVIPGKK